MFCLSRRLALHRSVWSGLTHEKEDPSAAVIWYQKAAWSGDADGQYCLGNMYRSGRGVGEQSAQENTNAAILLYGEAASKGHTEAQKALAEMFSQKNPTVAARWFREAADTGDSDAQYNLGQMYEKGEGVLKDFALAYMWYSLATINNYQDSLLRPGCHVVRSELAGDARDGIERLMPPEQIAEAQRLSREWKPKEAEWPIKAFFWRHLFR